MKIIEKKYASNEHVFFDSKKDTSLFWTPHSLKQYIGQSQLKERLHIYIESAKKRGTSPDHMLFFGPPGLGKTTLAEIIALELGKKIKITNGPSLQKTADLLALLSSLKTGDVFFIDEIHRLPIAVEEALYSAMEQYKIDIIIGAGAGSKTVTIQIPAFTLLAATTKLGLLSSPLRSRFGIIEKFDWYDIPSLIEIISQTGRFFGVTISEEAARKIATASRGTPRIAKKITAKVRDYAIVKTNNLIDKDIINEVFDFFDILENGLTSTDITILRILYEKKHPIGLDALGALINEEPATIEDVFEPFLLQLGFIERTPRGRVLRKDKIEQVEKLIN